MTISATETSLIISGAESPIASIEIDGNLVDFTAYDGTLASVTAGTPYTLSLSGFSDYDEAFYNNTGNGANPASKSTYAPLSSTTITFN